MAETPSLLFRRNNGEAITELHAINLALREIRGRVAPLDLSGVSPRYRELLAAATLDGTTAEQLKEHFLLSRERLVEIIRSAGREPQVDGGGALETHVSPHDYLYPQLYQIDENIDYSRFDGFHRNMAEDGSCAVDEVLQLLVGGPLDVLHVGSTGDTLFLRLECPSETEGWLLTYEGSTPHSGRMGAARPGTKAVVQVIGPARWVMDYDVAQGLEPEEEKRSGAT